MRPPVVLALLAALALAAPAGAQRVHHQTLAVGDRALGMGGAFTGLASDQAAAWYNPAGLALIDRGTVSGSLLLHAFEDLRLAEGELRLAQERRSNFPLFATGVLRVGATEGEGEEAAPHHAFGVVVLRPLRVSRRFELVFTTGKKHAQSIGSATSARTDVYFAPGLANTTLVVTPKGVVEVHGWPSTKADAHSLTLLTP